MNNHLHITLVGGQPVPVYQGVVYEKPDYVIYICSQQTLQEAERIAKISPVAYEIKTISPVDVNEVEHYLKTLASLIQKYEKLSINISSGTKIWSILFFDYFKNIDNTEIIYIDQNNKIWNLKTKTFIEQDFSVDIVTYLSLLGNTLKHFKKYDDITDEDWQVVSQIEQIRSFDTTQFNELIKAISTCKEYKGKKGSLIKYDKNDKSYYLNIINKKGNKEMVLKSPNIRYLLLNSGWFEVKVAQILSKWSHATEILINCEFTTNEGAPKNEVDIIVNTGKKLLFVECKTQVFNSTDVDKFASVLRIYGGMGTKGILLTDTKLRNEVIEKCNDNKLFTFNFKEISDTFSPEQMLFLKLESEWLNINPK